jgi:hypothetical protein
LSSLAFPIYGETERLRQWLELAMRQRTVECVRLKTMDDPPFAASKRARSVRSGPIDASWSACRFGRSGA